ncbi:hypothetical protein NHX12_024786 [Muraenolepis orangiensis]|uniref:Uncharacterized protein n=1 Tax=Muraenolepis orangiensis TaxID=630683 RepID=A0A9Q0IRN2_9TELE|nr:hypothetical protein NHX12_024786 [Muraenolepis orangiensis]
MDESFSADNSPSLAFLMAGTGAGGAARGPADAVIRGHFAFILGWSGGPKRVVDLSEVPASILGYNPDGQPRFWAQQSTHHGGSEAGGEMRGGSKAVGVAQAADALDLHTRIRQAGSRLAVGTLNYSVSLTVRWGDEGRQTPRCGQRWPGDFSEAPEKCKHGGGGGKAGFNETDHVNDHDVRKPEKGRIGDGVDPFIALRPSSRQVYLFVVS